MALFNADDQVRAIAERLATLRRTTVIEAVRQALERDLARVDKEARARERELDAALAQLDALPQRAWSDDDL